MTPKIHYWVGCESSLSSPRRPCPGAEGSGPMMVLWAQVLEG